MAINEEPPAPPPAEIVDTGSAVISIDSQVDEEAEEKPEDGIQVLTHWFPTTAPGMKTSHLNKSNLSLKVELLMQLMLNH